MPIGAHERPNKGATDVWLTPLEIIKPLCQFDLDPCAHPGHETARAKYFANGLELPWSGRVWLNPPYGEVGKWLDKLVEHGRGIALVFARTDTKWAQRILPKTQSIFFPAKRITFLKHDGTKPAGNAGAPSMFLSFGEAPHWPDLGPGLAINRRHGY